MRNRKRSILGCKFGGTSVKDAASILHIRNNIVRRNRRRRAIVVSAPAGVTNMLIEWVKSFIDRSLPDKDFIMDAVRDRFATMVQELGLSLDINTMFDEIRTHCEYLRYNGRNKELYDFAQSRGEWVNGQIVAEVLGFVFVDAADLIRFTWWNGTFDMEATRRRVIQIGLAEKVQRGVVIPGFYGRRRGFFPWSSGRIQAFSRGGSDITGAVVAVLVGASVYENWTDVAGIFAADPHVVNNPRKNVFMTFKELRELTFMGFTVFHEDAVAFVRDANIPIHVRCTMTPDKAGTMIVDKIPRKTRRPVVTGVASQNGFSIITLEKYGLNDDIGVQGLVERVFTKAGVGVNTTSSIDSITVIVDTAVFNPVRNRILEELKRFRADDIRIKDDIALVCTVGEGMRDRIGVSAAISGSLASSRINIELELQGGSQINVMRGVAAHNGPRAVRAVYNNKFLQ